MAEVRETARLRELEWIDQAASLSCLGLCYFASGISLTLYNKYIVSVSHYGFTFPITLILAHMLFNFGMSGLTVRCAPGAEMGVHGSKEVAAAASVEARRARR